MIRDAAFQCHELELTENDECFMLASSSRPTFICVPIAPKNATSSWISLEWFEKPTAAGFAFCWVLDVAGNVEQRLSAGAVLQPVFFEKRIRAKRDCIVSFVGDFRGDFRFAFCPARVVRAVAATRAAAASASKVELACENQKAAFPIKILFFAQLFHTCRLCPILNCQRAAGSL